MQTASGGLWKSRPTSGLTTGLLTPPTGSINSYSTVYTASGLYGTASFQAGTVLSANPSYDSGTGLTTLTFNNKVTLPMCTPLTLIYAFVMIAVSYATSAPDYTKIQGLTFATQTEANKADTAASWDWKDVTASVIILGCISFAYIYFRG